MQSIDARTLSNFWLVFGALALSISWLLPNHSLPWLGFHSDAWAATTISAVSLFVLWHSRFKVEWHGMPVTALLVAIIPICQYLFGEILSLGTAWINSLYLLGFALTLLVGASWEKSTRHQCVSFVLLATWIASICSVGLQLHQLTALDPWGPWTAMSTGSRHFANMAQPNQLASLLILALLACIWAYSNNHLGGLTAIISAIPLLFGIALTESRTGWINLFLLTCGIFFWRKLAPNKAFLRTTLHLAILFIGFALVVPALNNYFHGIESPTTRSIIGDPRWAAWKIFMQAAFARPITGFGWGQVAHAQFLILDENTVLGGSFLQAHNIFIDLILWCGIPLGIAIASALIWWMFRAFLAVRNFDQAILFLYVCVLGIHSMLEYPLQYAYFLLPLGLVMGTMNVSMGFKTYWIGKQWGAAMLLILAISALAVTIRDYFRIETSFYGLRFELKNIDTTIPKTPPEVIVLSQWRDHIEFARMAPRSGVDPEDLAWMRGVVSTQPSAYVMYRLALFLALNNQPSEAGKWLRRLCQVSPNDHCQAIKTAWEERMLSDPRIAAVEWPD